MMLILNFKKWCLVGLTVLIFVIFGFSSVLADGCSFTWYGPMQFGSYGACTIFGSSFCEIQGYSSDVLCCGKQGWCYTKYGVLYSSVDFYSSDICNTYCKNACISIGGNDGGSCCDKLCYCWDNPPEGVDCGADFYDNFVNYCKTDEVWKYQKQHDFYCVSGSCQDHISWTNDQIVENCNDQDGWYDTGQTRWVDVTDCTEKEQKEQENRNYYCSEGSCAYAVGRTPQWLDIGNTRNKENGDDCGIETRVCTAGENCSCEAGKYFCDTDTDKTCTKTCLDGICQSCSLPACDRFDQGADSDLDTYDNECENYPNDPCSVSVVGDNCGNVLGRACAKVDQNYCDYGCVQCGDGFCNCEENGYNCPGDCCVFNDGLCRQGCVFENDNDCEAEECEWTLLKEDNFEYEKTFGYPDEWWKKESWNEFEWYLEVPNWQGGTSDEYAFVGTRSAKCAITKYNPTGMVRATLIAPEFEHWGAPKKAMSFYFYMPEGQFEYPTDSIWINFDIIDSENKIWKNAIAGINRFGDISYGDGYGSVQAERPYTYFNGGFTLDYNKWYKLELYADFDKFPSNEEGMILKLYTDEKTYEWVLPLNSWSDQDWNQGYQWFEFSVAPYYFGIAQHAEEPQMTEAYFDNVKLYIYSDCLSDGSVCTLDTECCSDSCVCNVCGGAKNVYYQDADSDGFGDPNNATLPTCDVSPPIGYVSNSDDVDDTDPCSVNVLLDNCGNALGGSCALVDNNYCIYGCVAEGVCGSEVEGVGSDVISSSDGWVAHCGDWMCNCDETYATCPLDCEPIEVKVETICTDGLDNDGDGLIDNQDGDCWLREGAMTDEVLAYDDNPPTFLEYAEQIPGLKVMGIKTFRLCSIYEHVEGKPYPVVDYYKLDIARCVNKEEVACKEELKTLVRVAHENDMRIVIDFISSNAIEESWIYQNHPEWMMRDKGGEIVNCYPSAEWGPALDRTNPEVIAFLTEVAGYYVEEYGIDGFWVDSPQSNYNSEVVEGNHEAISLLRSVKAEIKNIKPSAVLITEVPHRGYADSPSVYDAMPFFDEMCECGYGQFFRRDVFTEMITGSILSNEVVEWLNKEEEILYERERVRFVSIHDKWAALFPSQYPEQHKSAITLMSTISGIPLVWTGELGSDVISTHYEAVLNIRNNNNALKYGSISNTWKSGDNTYAYLREYEDEKVIVILNFLDKEATSTLDLSFLPPGTVLYDELNDENFVVDNPGNFEISISAYTSRILIKKSCLDDGSACAIDSECCTGSCVCGTCGGSENTYYQDADGDGFGDPNNTTLPTCDVSPPTGYVSNSDDVDDNNPCSGDADKSRCGNNNEGCKVYDDNYCKYGCIAEGICGSEVEGVGSDVISSNDGWIAHCGDELVNCKEICEKASTRFCSGECGAEITGQGIETCNDYCTGWHGCTAPGCDWRPTCYEIGQEARCADDVYQNNRYQIQGTACCGGCDNYWTNSGTDSDNDGYDNQCDNYPQDSCSIYSLSDNYYNVLGKGCPELPEGAVSPEQLCSGYEGESFNRCMNIINKIKEKYEIISSIEQGKIKVEGITDPIDIWETEVK